MGIRQKLFLSFFVVLVLGGSIFGFAFLQFERIKSITQKYEASTELAVTATQVSGVGARVMQAFQAGVIAGSPDQAEADWFSEIKGSAEAQLAAMNKVATGESKATVEKLQTQFVEVGGVFEKDLLPYLKANAGKIELKSTEALVAKMSEKISALQDSSLMFRNAVNADQDKLKAELTEVYSRAIYLSLIALALAGAVILTFINIIVRSIVKPLGAAVEALREASQQVSVASGDLSVTAQGLSSTAQEQASAIEQTSASLTEISGMAEANVSSGEHVDEAARHVNAISEETLTTMDSLLSAMAGILETNQRIEKLANAVQSIGEKTEAVDEIVFKTQLLSFNASVEAERAGEHGRGFAVVAQEVGSLAKMSGDSANQISNIVKTTMKEAKTVAADNRQRVVAGEKVAGQTKEKMQLVLQSLAEVSHDISKIVAASREQGQGIKQISGSIENLNQATQKTAATSEEASGASAELSAQSQALEELVETIGNVVFGKKAVRRRELKIKKELQEVQS